MAIDIVIDSRERGLTDGFTAKAKSDGDDIISAVIEQAAQTIIDAVGK